MSLTRSLSILCFCCILTGSLQAQVQTDTVPSSPDTLVKKTVVKDTLSRMAGTDTISNTPFVEVDSTVLKPQADSSWIDKGFVYSTTVDFGRQALGHHAYFHFNAPWPAGTGTSSEMHHAEGKEMIFYLIILLLLIFAIMRQAFPKYFSDLFRVFFRTTLKQRQISEQLIQTPLPSLLLNLFFVLSGALYISFVLQHYQLGPEGSFWMLFLYSCIGLSLAYFVKFLGLKIAGWLFSMEEAANSYIFIVFVINKMIGILLLPFLLLLGFSEAPVYTAALTLSFCLVGAMLAYRVILTFAAVRNQVRVNLFHFFLYLCAFEIAPLLLVYKGLLLFLTISA